MQKTCGNCWVFVGALLCVLVIDWIVLNYNQQCSLYVQLEAAAAINGEAAAGYSASGGRQAQIRSGLRAVDSHSDRQSGTLNDN